MTSINIINIAKRYYNLTTGDMPNEVHLCFYNSEDGVAKCTILTPRRGGDITHEVEMNNKDNTIIMKRVLNEGVLSDFMREKTHISTLDQGDKFHLACDNTLYIYQGASDRYGDLMYGFRRADNNELFWLGSDAEVFPL